MMRFVSFGTYLLCIAFLSDALATGEATDPKEALQALQDYIGGWRGNGTSDASKTDIWKETASWSWRFKGKDVFLTAEMNDSKLFKSAELRFLPAKEKYQLQVTDKKGKTAVYEGELRASNLILEARDPDTNATNQIKFNTAGGGLRLIVTFSTKPENRTIFNRQFQIAYTKEGESFGATAKKNECVVTGGLGTSTVSYMGQTYYVCCSGCRDAFNEDPAKIIKEYLAKKKKNP